jgi:glyceraldehyde-3-phosphate dehydrogenase (NAD(P))
MAKIKVGVAGYGVIGQRLADGAALQGDMELVGVADVAPTLSVRALREKGMPYAFYAAAPDAGVGAKNKELYAKLGKKAIFQGGEKDSVAEVFFHGYANYEKGLGAQFLKLTSCNTTGLIRAVDCMDRAVGVEKVAITIIRRVADPGDYHRGLTNALQIDHAPSHQALDLMTVQATGILVHTPVTHGHIITIVMTTKKEVSEAQALETFAAHPRIRIVSIAEGFLGNASLFRYARDLGNPRGDMYEIALWEDSIVKSGKDLMFAINIPQESVTIPETMDGIRACMGMQKDRIEATNATNRYLGIGKWRDPPTGGNP